MVLVVAAVLGVLAGLLFRFRTRSLVHPVPVGRPSASLFAGAITLWHVFRTEQPETEEAMADADGGRTETDIVVVIGAPASLAGIATVLALCPGTVGRPPEAAICPGAVAASWLAIHAVYIDALRPALLRQRARVRTSTTTTKPSLADSPTWPTAWA